MTLAPISYKLRIAADLEVLDRRTGKLVFREENMEGSLTFPGPTLTGGMSEGQAQAVIWTVLSPMIVARTAEGLSSEPPPALSTAAVTAPMTSSATAPAAPVAPAVPAPR